MNTRLHRALTCGAAALVLTAASIAVAGDEEPADPVGSTETEDVSASGAGDEAATWMPSVPSPSSEGADPVGSPVAANVGREDAGGVRQLPLRVHVLESSVSELDVASRMGESKVQEQVEKMNRIFAPAGIEWVVERIVVERPADEGPFRSTIASRGKAAPALKALIREAELLAPQGWDLYVARDLSGLRVGGAYLCGAGGDDRGAAFIATHAKNGRQQHVRKWAHELGHAMGLQHTPCTADNADRLMMSGNCRYADPKRIAFSPDEIAKIHRQADRGGPWPCGGR